MPEESALEIVSRGCLLFVEGDLVDFLTTHFWCEGAERLGEGNLFIVGEMDLREDEHALLLQQIAQFGRMDPREQLFLVC